MLKQRNPTMQGCWFYCGKCKKLHKINVKVGQVNKHFQYKEEIPA